MPPTELHLPDATVIDALLLYFKDRQEHATLMYLRGLVGDVRAQAISLAKAQSWGDPSLLLREAISHVRSHRQMSALVYDENAGNR